MFLLETDGGNQVLKVTTSGVSRPQANRELRFYQDLAPMLSIRVPELLAATVVDEGVALLMSAHGPSTRARQWSSGRWMEAAVQAGRLHRDAGNAAHPTWLIGVAEPSRDAVTRAEEQWRTLGHPAIADQLPGLLAEATRLLRQAQPTIIHGDCHVENLLRSVEGDLVWVDWQEVTLGAGPEDLALLWQRAEFDGARPPRSDMMKAYCEARGRVLDEPLERMVLAAELRLLLAEWPHFLPYGQERQQATILRRLRETQHRWATT